MVERGAHNLLNEAKLKQADEKLKQLEPLAVLDLFIESRNPKLSKGTLQDYRKKLKYALPVLGLSPTVKSISQYLKSLSERGLSQGGVDDYFKNISAFYNWYFSPKSELTSEDQWKSNPVQWIERPGRPKLMLNWHTKESVQEIINSIDTIISPGYKWQARDKAIVAMLPESGLRREELTQLKLQDIDFNKQRIFVAHGKGNKPRLAPYGNLTKKYLTEYLQTVPDLKPDDFIWRTKANGHLTADGVSQALERIGQLTGKHINPHSFRRTFAIWLRLEGVDTLMIRDLGGWESVEMVERYTRSLEKEKALQFYKSPFGNSLDEFKNQIGIQPDITSIIQRELGGKMDIDDIDKLIAKLKVGLPTLSP